MATAPSDVLMIPFAARFPEEPEEDLRGGGRRGRACSCARFMTWFATSIVSGLTSYLTADRLGRAPVRERVFLLEERFRNTFQPEGRIFKIQQDVAALAGRIRAAIELDLSTVVERHNFIDTISTHQDGIGAKLIELRGLADTGTEEGRTEHEIMGAWSERISDIRAHFGEIIRVMVLMEDIIARERINISFTRSAELFRMTGDAFTLGRDLGLPI